MVISLNSNDFNERNILYKSDNRMLRIIIPNNKILFDHQRKRCQPTTPGGIPLLIPL